jgi:hypothetical protein
VTRAVEIAVLAWLAFMAAAGVLAIYEIVTVMPDTPGHTISFFSSKHLWLAIVILVAVPVGAIVFDVWFWWHIHQVVLKLSK